MKIPVKLIISFVAGVAVGVAATAKYFDSYYRDIADEEIADVKRRRSERHLADGGEEPILPEKEEKTDNFRRQYQNEEKPDPSELVKKYNGEEVSEEDLGDDDEEAYQYKVDFTDPKEPYLITEEEFEAVDTFEKEDLVYWEEDDTLSDSRDEIVDDVVGVVGYLLTEFGDEEFIHVRNERLAIDFEVQRMEGSYQENVLGIKPDRSKSRRDRTEE